MRVNPQHDCHVRLDRLLCLQRQSLVASMGTDRLCNIDSSRSMRCDFRPLNERDSKVGEGATRVSCQVLARRCPRADRVPERSSAFRNVLRHLLIYHSIPNNASTYSRSAIPLRHCHSRLRTSFNMDVELYVYDLSQVSGWSVHARSFTALCRRVQS